MTEALLTSLSMENHGHSSHSHGHGHGHMGAPPSTLLSMDSSSAAAAAEEAAPPHHGHGHHHNHNPPDINLPLSVAEICAPPSWPSEPCCDILDVSLGSQIHDTDALLNLSKSSAAASAAVNNIINPSAARKCARRGDSIWGAWFFFNFYFKPALTDKAKSKLGANPSCGGGGGGAAFDKADLRLDLFLVQHDMENMYMWAFKERPENALGKMQLRSFMNGHSRLGEPQFPFSVDKGFVRSHRMQRKHYRGLSNPQCVHGIEVVRSPNLSLVTEGDLKKWIELTGRDLNFSIPHDAEAFTAWRNLPSTDFELERPPPPPTLKTHNPNGNINNHNNMNSSNIISNSNSNSSLNCSTSCSKRLLNGAGLNLSTQLVGICSDSIEPSLSPPICCSKRRKEYSPMGNDEECCLQHYPDRIQEIDMIHQVDPAWANDFSGVMRQACGPVTAAKTIYEDEKGYLILVSLPFTDSQRVRVSWRNTVTHGIVKVHCISTARTPYIKRGDRTFKLTDPSPEHCPPGEFVREIALATRIPENAELQAYYVEAGAGLEIMVPKHHVLSEEHEVRVFLRPQLGPNELLLT